MSGFGFSPSDVVKAIDLVVKARRALRDVGGAKDDFQISMLFLCGLEQTLKSVREHAEIMQDSTQVAIMAHVANIVEKHLSEKLDGLESLDKTLGGFHTRSTASMVTSKLKWALHLAQEVEKMQKKIMLPLLIVNINLASLSLSAFCDLKSSIPDVISARVEGLITRAAIARAQTEVTEAGPLMPPQPPLDIAQSIAQIPRAINDRISQFEEVIVATNRSGGVQAANELDQVVRKMQHLNLSLAKSGFERHTVSRSFNAPPTGPICSQKEFYRHFWSCFVILVMGVRALLIRLLQALDSRYWAFFRKIGAACTVLPKLLMQDYIFLEDVLSRTHALPYQNFRTFRDIHIWLCNAFAGHSGSKQVVESQYRLLLESSFTVVSRTGWATLIQPNARLLMSIVRDIAPSEADCCPRCHSTDLEELSDTARCLTCKLLYHKDPTTAFDIEVRKFRFGISETTSPLFDHGKTGDDLFILPRDSRNPDICAFTRVHTRVVDLPALWLDAISNLLFDILDCAQAVNDTERPPNVEDDLGKSARSLSTVAQEFYETSLHLTALRPPGATFWDLIDYRSLAATTFSEIRMHLGEARSWLYTNTASSCAKNGPGRSAAIALQAAARSAQEHMSSVCEHSAAPKRALSGLKYLKAELGSQLQDYDSILSTIRSFLIQEIDYEEARQDIQNILDHHNKALIQTIDDCVLPDLRNVAEEIFPVGLKQRKSRGDNQFQGSAMDSPTDCPSDDGSMGTRQRSTRISSSFPKSALSPSQEGSARLCCNYPECTDNFGWPNRYFTRRADLRLHLVSVHGEHNSKGREGSTDVAPGSTDTRFPSQAGLRQLPSAEGHQLNAMSAMSEGDHDKGLTPRNSFDGRQGPDTYGEKTGSMSSAVGRDDHYKEHYKVPPAPGLYGEHDAMSIETRQSDKRRHNRNAAGRVSHEGSKIDDDRNSRLQPAHPLHDHFLPGGVPGTIPGDQPSLSKQTARLPPESSWGSKKAGRPRKRMKEACISCRKKKLLCRPTNSSSKCLPCEKSGGECHFANTPRTRLYPPAVYASSPISPSPAPVPHMLEHQDSSYSSRLDEEPTDGNDRDRSDTCEGLSQPSLPLVYPQSLFMMSDSPSSRAEPRREFPRPDRVADPEDSLKNRPSDGTYPHRSDEGRRRAVEARGPIYSSRINDYFLPGEGISREVISAEICRYLGNDALVRPYRHVDGRNGYMIRAYRPLTSAMIAELKETRGDGS